LIFSASSISAISFSLLIAASRSSLSLAVSTPFYASLRTFSAALCLESSMFLSLLRMNFYLSASLSLSISFAHWVLSIACS
jgi:hypothetical protein